MHEGTTTFAHVAFLQVPVAHGESATESTWWNQARFMLLQAVGIRDGFNKRRCIKNCHPGVTYSYDVAQELPKYTENVN